MSISSLPTKRQFSPPNPQTIMKSELRRSSSSTSPNSPPLPNSNIFTSPQGSISGALRLGCLNTLDGSCIEKLLIHCASALDNKDVTLAQQVMWVLNNVASSLGDPNQRLASYFLRALISKASRICPTSMSFNPTETLQWRLMSVTDLAGYVDLIPWHRFGFCASNSAILKAIQGFERIHVLDFSITYCMQLPTLIDALAKNNQEHVPFLKVSVLSWRPPVPPLLNVSIEEVGQRLSNFAKFKDVPFEFNVIKVDASSQELLDHHQYELYELILSELNPIALELKDDEALVVNFQNWLRYLPDEQTGYENSIRDTFLERIKSLSPCLVTIVDEDCDLGVASGSLSSRITSCFNYLWIPFDALETFLPKDSPQRIEYEADVGQKIENVIGFEGVQRIERLESGMKLCQRMGNNGFVSVPFCEETLREVRVLLDEHASGWGMKKDEDMLVLTWKGHNSVYATVWVPHEEHGWDDNITIS